MLDGLLTIPKNIQDYYATPYAAEIVNTLTNLLFMYLGVKGVLNVRNHGHAKVFEVAFYGYLLVGTGSFLFHSTLKCKSSMPPYHLGLFYTSY